jgi:ubiquinone/menaquinone biosynthesis C-methylase UbiE
MMPPRESAAAYDRIGVVYDQDSHEEITHSFYRRIRSVVRRAGQGLVLDLGCGTGLLTERLARHRCRIRAVDGSGAMLKVARARCRSFATRVEFQQADITELDGSGLAAAAFACGDIVNHFPNDRAVRSCFRSVHRHLEVGGVFMFDALSRWCFENYWSDRTYYMAGRHGDLVMECDWDSAERVGTAEIVVFACTPCGRYTRRKTQIRERLIDRQDMRVMLKAAGFRRVDGESWSPWSDQWCEPCNDRILWTAVK